MIREMTLADALHVIGRMRESDRRALAAVCPGMTDEAFAMDRYSTDYRWTVCAADGEPVVIGGARLTQSRTAMLWMVATPRLNAVIKTVMRFAGRFCRELFVHDVARRLEGSFIEGEAACERWAARFGMEFEGCRRKAGANGENIVIFGKVD